MAGKSKRIEERRRRKMRRTLLFGGAFAVAVGVVAASIILTPGPPTSPPPPPPPQGDAYAVINTASGRIVFQFYETEVPATSAHFIQLFQSGYYNGLKWHRVENWVIQTGQGSTTSTINLEINSSLHNLRGYVGVARTSDPNSGSSQFYILRSDSTGLDGQYAIFGKVTASSMAVVDNVALNEVISTATFQRSATPPT